MNQSPFRIPQSEIQNPNSAIRNPNSAIHNPQSEIKIRDQSIRLGQFLKLANVAASGGEAKIRIKAGEAVVNGRVETRRGAQLHHGDEIEISGQRFVLAAASASADSAHIRG